MAGLLDSDIVKFLVAPRAYYRDKAAQQSADRFGGLLGTLEQQGPVNPGDPGGLLSPRAPDAQFWLKAAQIPGYEGLAGQQLGIQSQGQQAMQRQEQQQGWSQQNMTAAQQQQLMLEQLKADRTFATNQQDLARKWYGTEASAAASRASAANSNASQQLTGMRMYEQGHKNSLLDAPAFARLPAQQQVEGREKMSIIDRGAAGALDVADWAGRRATGAALPGPAGTSEANVMRQEWQFGVKPVVMQMLNTGVLQPAEEDMVQELIGKPDDYMLTQSQLKSIQNMMLKVQDRRQDLYKSYGLEAAPIGLGQSAAARTLTQGKASGELKDVTSRPGGDTQRQGLKPLLERPGGNERYPGKIDRKS